MKFKSKLVSLILALTMVLGSLGTIGMAATFSDVDNSKSYASAVSLLAALELLKGDGDGTFRPEGDITRAEFATVVVRTLGQEDAANAAAGQYAFDDVATDSWASGFISIASTLGIISGYGDGNFGPEDNVTYEQAVKMLVCALGYEPLAFNIVGDDASLVWPGGYLAAASQLNILTAVAGTEGVAAKRWQVARLVYNSLEVDLMEKTVYQNEERHIITNKNILNDYLNLYRSRGEVIANSTASSSDSVGRVREGEVLIRDNSDSIEYLFADGGIDTKGLIGRSITFYYSRSLDDDRTLVSVEDRTSETDVLVIEDASSIEHVFSSMKNGGNIEYWKNESDRSVTTVQVAPNPTILLNGAVYSGSDTDVLMPDSGSLELIDSNRSGSFDRVLVTSYETYVVRSVNSTDRLISDNYRDNDNYPTITLDTDDTMNDITFVRSNGSSASFSNISRWAVLSVKKANIGGREKIEVIISTETVSGSITGIDDESTIYINEKQYKISKYYQNYAQSNFSVDDSGKFYLDKDGKIAGFDKTDSSSSNYGFLRGVTYNRDALTFSIMTHSSSSITQVAGASRVRIDTETFQGQNVVNKLRSIMENNIGDTNIDKDEGYLRGLNDSYAPQLVKYTVNSSGAITAIQTISGTDLNQFTLNYDIDADGDKVMKYNSSSRQFSSNNKADDAASSLLIDSNTQVFIVSDDRTKTDGYSRRKGTGYFKDGIRYIIEAYDVPEGSSIPRAPVVVVYAKTTIKPIDARSPVAIYQNHSLASDAPDTDYNAKVKVYLIGYEQTPGTMKELWAKPSAINVLSEGDAFRFKATNLDYIDEIEPVLTARNASSEIKSDRLTTGTAEFRMFGGTLSAAEMDSSIETTSSIGITLEDGSLEYITITKSITVFGYNINEVNRLTILDPAYPFDTLPSTKTVVEQDTPCRVFVVKTGDTVRAVYFIK